VAGLAPQAGGDSEEALTGGGEHDLSIVVVGYNSRDELRSCLASIREHAGRVAVETIVVDNESSDGTAACVRREFPGVRVFENTANLGYSRAVNQGIRESRGRYILILNPDVVVRAGALGRLVEFMDAHPDGGMAGAKLLNPDGSVQDSCRRFHTFWTLILRRTPLGRAFPRSRALSRYLMRDFDHNESREVEWLLGACMIARRAALEDIGLMDERFFMYFEDVDWCYRTSKSGWKVYYVADAVMEHRHARESARPGISRQLLVHIVSLFHFYEKWGGLIYSAKRYWGALRTALLLVSDLVAINGSFFLAYAFRSSLKGLLTRPMFGVGVYTTFLVFANIVLVFSFGLFGLYGARSKRQSGADLLLRVFQATFVAAIILMASTFMASEVVYSRLVVVAFAALVVVVATLLRVLLKWFHRVVRAAGFDLTRTVIVGTGEAAVRLGGRILAHPELGYDIAGLIETGERGRPSGLPVLGGLSDLPRLIEDQRIGEVIFADPRLSYDRMADFLVSARRSRVDVKMVSGLTTILTQRARVEEFLDVPVLSFEREALLKAGAAFKRSLDVAAASLLFVLWLPFLAATAVARGGSGRGAPIRTVPRAGLGGRVYAMCALAPSGGGLRSFLDRHGLSRFPAIVNVLRGDMSFVGPAPLEPGVAAGLSSRERMILDARPGIFGLAEVSGAHGGPDGDPVALDAYYVQNWSLEGDLVLVLKWLNLCMMGGCAGETASGGPRGRPPRFERTDANA
jgi:GT2 family glycosyltransferase/lipopolysaccharide/colanic/teichoic acid biosynthesis glycosyltransferase